MAHHAYSHRAYSSFSFPQWVPDVFVLSCCCETPFVPVPEHGYIKRDRTKLVKALYIASSITKKIRVLKAGTGNSRGSHPWLAGARHLIICTCTGTSFIFHPF